MDGVLWKCSSSAYTCPLPNFPISDTQMQMWFGHYYTFSTLPLTRILVFFKLLSNHLELHERRVRSGGALRSFSGSFPFSVRSLRFITNFSVLTITLPTNKTSRTCCYNQYAMQLILCLIVLLSQIRNIVADPPSSYLCSEPTKSLLHNTSWDTGRTSTFKVRLPWQLWSFEKDLAFLRLRHAENGEGSIIKLR